MVVNFGHKFGGVDADAMVGGGRARLSGRSWWGLKFTDKIVHEWDSDPGSPNGHADWPRLPLKGRQAIRLYCPNGKLAELGEVGKDNTGKLFQFKIATVNSGVPNERETLAHVIGMITGTNGSCTCFAWEINGDGSGQLVGPWTDNVNCFMYHMLGKLSGDHLGIEM